MRNSKTVVLALVVVSLMACGEDEPAGDSLFECADGRNGWEQCVDDTVQWCHVTPEDAHFHLGRNCANDGLSCAAQGNVAYCADPTQTCEEGTPGMCDERQAINCVDGMVAYRRCGVGKACVINAAGWAVCEDL